jgi:flavodoxin
LKKKILIFGAGSIGNHMSFAAHKLGFQVFITDINSSALVRMKDNIYPQRYGKWESSIVQINYKDLNKVKNYNFDIIIIGTPPHKHKAILKFCIDNFIYKKILVEKPLYVYNQKLDPEFILNNKNIFCGYNHSISRSFQFFLKKIKKYKDQLNLIDVKWKEGWFGILNAHHWLKNEFDSYLGNIRIGGGALHEHSHGVHLLIIILENLNLDIKKFKIKKNILFKNKQKIKYDKFCNIFGTYKSKILQYETDLITFPYKKEIRLSGDNISLSWTCSYENGKDLVKIINKNKIYIKKFIKTRSSEFENEIQYIQKNRLNKKNELSLFYANKVIEFIKSILK